MAKLNIQFLANPDNEFKTRIAELLDSDLETVLESLDITYTKKQFENIKIVVTPDPMDINANILIVLDKIKLKASYTAENNTLTFQKV